MTNLRLSKTLIRDKSINQNAVSQLSEINSLPLLKIATMTDLKLFLKTLTVIHLALIVGQVIFIVISMIVIGKTDIILSSGEDILFFIVPGFAIMALLAGNMVFKKILDSAKGQKTDSEKLAAYRSACIIRFALTEGPSLFAIVAYFLSGNLYYIFISGFLILFLFTLRPTKEKVEMDLGIQIPLNTNNL